MKKLFIVLILLVFAIPAKGAIIYRWVDEKGVVNFTDEYKRVPLAFHNTVETEEYLEEQPPFSSKEQPTTDTHERDYWEKQLDEATSNYEKARDELLREGERLVWTRYGGKTQFQMFTVVLPSFSERVEFYREQMIEAKAMFEKFTKEAKKAEDARGKRGVFPQTDIYGRDETWWKEKARPWKEQLKEAEQGYEEASDTIVKQLERLGPFRWGGLSLTQYQMISSRLTGLYGQMMEYQTQISEAKGKLAKLSREAQETKADPAWLE